MAHEYTTHDPKGWCGDITRGAALGRPTLGKGATPVGKFTLRRVRLNAGGYDSLGTYWGVDAPLYWYSCDSTEGDDIEGHIRAYDRDDAKDRVRARYPTATFLR